jgi:hypothetical protein
MIVKINDQYMRGSVLNTNDLPEGFGFFPAYKVTDHTLCYLSDGDDNLIAPPFTIITLPSAEVDASTRMVGIPVLDEYGLPHANP